MSKSPQKVYFESINLLIKHQTHLSRLYLDYFTENNTCLIRLKTYFRHVFSAISCDVTTMATFQNNPMNLYVQVFGGRKGVWDIKGKRKRWRNIVRRSPDLGALWLVKKNRSVMAAKMADPPSEGWPSFLSETMSGLEANFSNDRAINEPMMGDFDGRSFGIFILAISTREILLFLAREQWSPLVVYAPTFTCTLVSCFPE